MNKIIKSGLLLILAIIYTGQISYSQNINPIMNWDFNNVNNRTISELATNIADTLEGNFEIADGISGNGIRFDGFTTCAVRSAPDVAEPGDEFTVEGWIALGNYPWNWCPLLTTESYQTEGYRLMVGPIGQASFQVAIGGQWISCTSEENVLPLRTWLHIVGVYRADNSLSLYINGEKFAEIPIRGYIKYSNQSDCRIGMIAAPEKPSDIHRTWGTVAAYYGLDGIIDEVKVFDYPKDAKEVKTTFTDSKMIEADVAPRKLPTINKNPGRFGAFYTKLEYYPGWDNLWPVEQDPDIVVCFEKSPVKLVFWRGIRYAASWVSENENWMSDQSVEAWGVGENDTEGCFEHMQDRHCRFSSVRIIENTDARVVVHWRYALVSSNNNTWRVDPKTGWECWIDEYYYIYPDASAIRKVSWKKGSLGFPRQFQETLAILQPGQVISDLLEKDFTTVSDYEGNTNKQSFVEKPKPLNWADTHNYTIQQYNFKSEYKPFISFEPDNKMLLRDGRIASYDKPGGCNHFPVGQARCDGRTTKTSDRPSHCTSFPISEPTIHEKGDRYYWNALYGMNNKNLSDLVVYGRSWAYSPEISIKGNNYISRGYDTSERCYQIDNVGSKATKLQIELNGNEESPVQNPAFYIKGWNAEKAEILVNGKKIQDNRIGVKYELDGTDLIVFLFLQEENNIEITIVP